ncbi:MAG: acyltransferase [Alphaproteobacteria bacterium]|nr:acyltransferase [Alphaproteobacteria bacterium]
MKYRAEIDGLRAIAVMSVVIYHAEILFGSQQLQLFEGGFIGVDIFFVISGYLITKIILSELQEKNSFNFLKFYERRARRILPMLFTVMAVSIPFAWVLLLPPDFLKYSQSILSALFFVSNFFFYQATTGYWAENSQLLPFLHTWSLSIEEQFYVFYPILLLFIHRFFKNYMLTFVMAILLLSLEVAHMLGAVNQQDLNFYFSLSRFWELLAGGILAQLELRYGRTKHGALSAILPIIGLYLITHAILFFDKNTIHPGFITLIPILGVCLVIAFSSKDDFVGRMLGSKPLMLVGLWSYSIYLWHFPIFAFSRIEFARLLLTEKLGLVALTVILSIFSYYLIENPMRRKLSRKYVLGILAVAFFALLVFFALGVQSKGYSSRVPSIFINNETIGVVQAEIKNEIKACYAKSQHPFCSWHAETNNPKATLYIIGDSHMRELTYGLFTTFKRDYDIVIMYSSACYFNLYTKLEKQKCTAEYQQARFDQIKNDESGIIIMGGRLSLYLRRNYTTNNGETLDKNVATTINNVLNNGHHVIVVYPVPVFDVHVPRTLLNQAPSDEQEFADWANNTPLTFPFATYQENTKDAFAILDSVQHSRLHRIYPHQIFCNTTIQGQCLTHTDKEIYYKDSHHLSQNGTYLVNQNIIETINNITKN